MVLRSKRAQLTLFIILGITLIIIVIIGIYVQRNRIVNQDNEDIISQELRNDPIYAFVYDCLEISSKEALITIGEHAGLADLNRLNFRFGDDATNSDAVILAPKTTPFYSVDKKNKNAIPYYWFMSSPSGCLTDCNFNLFFPNLHSGEDSPTLEDELNYYVNNNINECLQNFSSLKQRGFSFTNIGAAVTSSAVNAQTVSFTLKMPVEATLGQSSYKFDNFYVKHDIDLGSIYYAARELTVLQGTNRFLEGMSLNLLSDYGSINGEIPPMADSTFKFGSPGKVWVKTKVKKFVQDLFTSNTPLLRVMGSKNYVSLGDDAFERKLMDSQMAIPLTKRYDLDIYFNYLPGWGFYFDMNCDGELCKPESFSNTFSILVGNQRYKFYYSYAFPVLVKIHDSKAFNGQGYDYYFFLENNVRFSETLEQGDYEFADWLTAQRTDFLCEESNKNSGNYSMRFRNAISNQLLTEVTVFLTCGQDTCTIGSSANSSYSTKLPVCVPGTLSFVKEGYMPKSVGVATQLDQVKNLGDIMLEPIRKKNISINKVKFTKAGQIWREAGEAPLKANQEAIVTISRDAVREDEQMQQVIILNHTHLSEEIMLVPGDFKVSVLLLDKNTIIIPEETREIETLFSSQEYTVPGVRFNATSPYILGGLEGNFTVYPDIDRANSIVLNVVAFEMGEVPQANRKIEDLAVMGQVFNYSVMYHDRLGFFAR